MYFVVHGNHGFLKAFSKPAKVKENLDVGRN